MLNNNSIFLSLGLENIPLEPWVKHIYLNFLQKLLHHKSEWHSLIWLFKHSNGFQAIENSIITLNISGHILTPLKCSQKVTTELDFDASTHTVDSNKFKWLPEMQNKD